MSKAENFETGEVVKIVDRIHGHEFDIGTVVTLKKTENNDYAAYDIADLSSDWWYVLDDELSKVKTLSSIKNKIK